jgi:hypothetical protein
MEVTMRRTLPFALPLLLLFAVAALPEDRPGSPALDLPALQEKVEKQAAEIGALQAYVANAKEQAARLSEAVAASEKEGFLLPAPNNEAKRLLLDGIREYARVAAGGKPAPKEEEPK